MRKKFYLYTALILAVIVLIFAFQNVLSIQPYNVLFSSPYTSATVVILVSALLGFLIGFFAMLYSVELGREKKAAQEMEEAAFIPPDTTRQDAPTFSSGETPPEDIPSEADSFDEDDEVLG